MKCSFHPLVVAAAAAALFLPGRATAQNLPGQERGPQGEESRQGVQEQSRAPEAPVAVAPEQILRKLHESNQIEIQSGRLAEKNAQSREVRDFGRMLVEDHQRIDRNVEKLAKEKKIDLAVEGVTARERPAASEQMAAVRKLGELRGVAFDRMFIQMNVQDHMRDVQELNEALAQVQDDELKKLIAESLPLLEKHLSVAVALEQRLSGEGAAPQIQPGMPQSPEGRQPEQQQQQQQPGGASR
jgi:putative membrane protein